MGARIIKHHDSRVARVKEARAAAIIFAAVVGPLLLTYLLIAADMRSDLSELEFRHAAYNGDATLVAWKDLKVDERPGHQPHAAEVVGGHARMLGYMMDGTRPVRDGTAVKMFVLMPEAGQFLHPAHRVPDEMVEVWIAGGHTIPYLNRSLVWVEGDLHPVGEKATPGNASYAMKEAFVERASDGDIVRWSAH